MKVLTVLGTIAIPALAISGIYGMNLKGVPFQDSPTAPSGSAASPFSPLSSSSSSSVN
jgi:hypothetical protein